MKLKRLRLEQFRQFRSPLEILGLDPGLNLFTGENETGKSSIVRAIRAAFFERYRSTSVDDLRPWGDSLATPTVELEFDIGDTAYHLTKCFLQRKRCDLMAGGLKLEGVDAEDHLAALLGFQFAGKGASKIEHWGIPGLLWIEQGEAQKVHAAVSHATDHLRTALNESVGEVAATGGDEIVVQLRALRDELLTSGGKPRAAYAQAIARQAELAQIMAGLDELIATYRQQVDNLGILREQHADDETERPWEAYRRQQASAEEALQAITQLEKKLTDDRANLKQCESTQELLRQQLSGFDKQQADLDDREKTLIAAIVCADRAQNTIEQLSPQAQAADRSYQQAREALRIARQEDNRAKLQAQAHDSEGRTTVLAESVVKAEAEHSKLAVLRAQAAATEIRIQDLEALRQQHARLRELEIRQAANATRLSYALAPGKTVSLSEESLSGQGERLLTASTELSIPDVGRLQINPGGTDLAELIREQGEAYDEHRSMLQRLGIASLEDAEARHHAYRQHLSDIGYGERTLAVLAPKGLDALRSEHTIQAARIADAQAALSQLPSSPDAPVLGLQAAEDQQEDARKLFDNVTAQVNAAQQALVAAQSERDSAQRERDALHTTLQDPTRQQRVQQASQALIDARALQTTLAERIETQVSEIAAAKPDILKQDVERFRRSAEQTEKQFRDRRDAIIRLESALQSTGAQGLEEQRAALAGEAAQVERRHTELNRRADALDYLLTRLESKRSELMRRLQAPLQKHLNRYLPLLFPEATLQIDEHLAPGPLTRPGALGPETGEFEALSFGAREQMGVISRLAYADLLQDAGRPTLIILDDALVHSDEQRLAQMKRVLFDAAQRHQILLFTCHPAAWRDMGVAPRTMESLRSAVKAS